MSDTASGGKGSPEGGNSVLAGLGTTLKGSDVTFALGFVAILLVLIVPVPSWLLDLMLAASLTLSVVILMTVLFIEKPLEFNSFPTVLLVATMMRLSLNVASTRLILAEGHTGPDAAGAVIQAFGSFLMGGSVIIGITILMILIIVNMVVITKGSGRIAEVAARFSLDAMPGKQMAIDADMSSGLINEEQALLRRRELEDESTFFGAMDGAAKFVRGDAIAGIIITLVNIIVGMIIGIVINDLTFAEAGSRYTLLTIGDGLVSNIPSLFVSTAAGLLVTKAGLRGKTDKALFGQMSAQPRSLGVAGGLLVAIGMMPGLPILPFAIFGGSLLYAAYSLAQRAEQKAVETAAVEETEAADAVPADEPITSALAIDQLRLELGYGLLTLINDDSGFRLTDQIKALRRQLAGEMGFVMPSVRILDNMQLPANSYVLRVKETEVGRGDIRPGMLLIMDPEGQPVQIPGEATTEPAFGLPATWVDASAREEASFRGYTVVDAATVVTTHLTEVIKDNMADLLSYAETQKLLEDLPSEHQKLIADIVPSQITTSGLQRILQTLLVERVSIRDLPTILEGVAEATGFTQNIVSISEHVRTRLSRQLCAVYANHEGLVPLITLSPEWEQAFAESLVGAGEEKQLAMAPTRLQEFINAVRIVYDQQAGRGETPVLLTSPLVRPYVRSIVERFRPTTTVMSQNEIHPQAKIRTLGQI
ncbi:MAG: flagellar biosynthesis protein FlhA [Kordiimonadales bacterium]|nr:MAG: flagellar biosynthesis protein FlhA [Kordiimonadales bacterium]